MLPLLNSVSYTHLDVYTRQDQDRRLNELFAASDGKTSATRTQIGSSVST